MRMEREGRSINIENSFYAGFMASTILSIYDIAGTVDRFGRCLLSFLQEENFSSATEMKQKNSYFCK